MQFHARRLIPLPGVIRFGLYQDGRGMRAVRQDRDYSQHDGEQRGLYADPVAERIADFDFMMDHEFSRVTSANPSAR